MAKLLTTTASYPLRLLWLLVFSHCLAAQPTADSLAVLFAPGGGFYRQAVTVQLTAVGSTAIYYTLDGSLPGQHSFRYTHPIPVSKTTVIRALAFRDDQKGHYAGQTYFINEPLTQFPVVSIAITPELLFDPRDGIFVAGIDLQDAHWKQAGANFWTNRELSCHTDLFEAGGQPVFSSMTGFRLFGGMSRLFPQKSMALVARSRYGASHFDYPIFGKSTPDKFSFLVLRNSGSDFGKSQFRDGLMTGLVKDWDLETQAFRPAQVYINGTYWGIYNLREKINKHFIADHFPDIDKDSIDLLEHRWRVRSGSSLHYRQMLQFIETHSLQDTAAFAAVERMMDTDNFLRYQIAQIYFDNRDAGGNIKYWRPRQPEGRWRWILYDTDQGFGLHHRQAYQFNSLAFHTAPDGPDWPNPPWSTFLLRKLLANPHFRTNFVNRFCDALNTRFSPLQVSRQIDSLVCLYEGELPRHWARWQLNAAHWHDAVATMQLFARERPHHMRRHLQQHFQAGEQRVLRLQSSPGGRIVLNDNLVISGETFEGLYFSNYPVRLTAQADYGYKFDRWEGKLADPQQRVQVLNLRDAQPLALRAVFVPFKDPHEGRIVINEICPRNPVVGDWVEIHNRSDEPVRLGQWILTDYKHEYTFPDIVLEPNDYLVVCEDAARFRAHFPDAYLVVGGLTFGLHKQRERLGLYTAQGAFVDSTSYALPLLDSIFTISLLLPTLDNADPHNWEVRMDSGTPNTANPLYLALSVRSAQTQWLRAGVWCGLLLLAFLSSYKPLVGILRKIVGKRTQS